MHSTNKLRIAAAFVTLTAIGSLRCGVDDTPSPPSGNAANGGAAGQGQGGGFTPDDAGPPPGSMGDCPAFTSGNDLKVCTATYLGGAGADMATAVDLSDDGTIIVGGSFPNTDFGVPGIDLLGGGDGAVIRLSPAGGKVLSHTHLPTRVDDLELAPDGRIAVVGAFGVALLDATASHVVWSDSSKTPASRVSVGSDQAVAVLAGQTVSVFKGDGSAAGSFDLADGTISDLAVHGESASVIVTGFNQVSSTLQQPFVRAYGYDGAMKWKAYDWNASQADAFGSDTRGYAVSIGRDGKLYYAGESHGGSTTHFKDPRDLSKDAPIVRTDKYNDSYNWNGAAPLAFYARFEPSDGILEVAGLIAPRLSSGKGNGAHIQSITANESGTVLLGGTSSCCIEGGDSKTVNGLAAMPGYAGGAFVFAVSKDFATRHLWTTFSGGVGSGVETRALSARGGVMAVVQTQLPDKESGIIEGHMLTTRALQPDPGGGLSEGFLAVWRAP